MAEVPYLWTSSTSATVTDNSGPDPSQPKESTRDQDPKHQPNGWLRPMRVPWKGTTVLVVGNGQHKGKTGRVPPSAGSSKATLTDGNRPEDDPSVTDKLTTLKAFAAMEAEKLMLQKALDAAKSGQGNGDADVAAGKGQSKVNTIPKPNGTAGLNFSIQAGMRLDRSAKKRHTYKALQYVNNWATEELTKQYLKNKRNHAYKMGYIECPAGYDHLKENASKRSNAPRGKRARPLSEESVRQPEKRHRLENDKDKDKEDQDQGAQGGNGVDGGDESD
ncbi:hypothetical protein H0H81_003542 [Sphagnurus paluster]|uniref:Uncharacterized protein n=1 Tax=Sphagnurus paluster TaxID=117069 RepID=A0A9P7GJ65_9AGAR|nr:hypothetical protein H0H81_003542 [Sphagnurus paluster]